MKKNVLALSIAAAIGGLGFAGGAFAVTTAVPGTGVTATNLAVSAQGIGHILLVPYYTAQDANATLLNIVNTDTTNAKAVKVRFRGAANSDDVFDFQVFLSPGDVWAGNISKDAATGLAKMTTTDSSCTKPANVNLPFVTGRLNQTLTAEGLAAQTLEGYVEIFNMADIPPTRTITSIGIVNGTLGSVAVNAANELYTAVKHVSGANPPCSGTAWSALDTDRDYTAYTTSSANGLMANPTSGLMGNWTIINVNDASAWSAAASAIVGTAAPAVAAPAGALVYFPQMSAAVVTTASSVNGYTADPLFRTIPVLQTASIVAPQQFDLPDLSTPYTTATPTPEAQANLLSSAIAARSVKNEFLTDASVNGTTDWVFSMPTRRYSAAVDYAYVNPTTQKAAPRIVYNAGIPAYFTSANTTLVGDQICLMNVSATDFDRNEKMSEAKNQPVISPNVPGPVYVMCGEASVLTINQGDSVLHAAVAVKNLDTTQSQVDGWISLATPGATGAGLPVLGGAFVRATAGASTFGANWDHRYVK